LQGAPRSRIVVHLERAGDEHAAGNLPFMDGTGSGRQSRRRWLHCGTHKTRGAAHGSIGWSTARWHSARGSPQIRHGGIESGVQRSTGVPGKPRASARAPVEAGATQRARWPTGARGRRRGELWLCMGAVTRCTVCDCARLRSPATWITATYHCHARSRVHTKNRRDAWLR